MVFNIVVIFSLCLPFVCGNPTVHTKLGTIIGTEIQNDDGTPVYRFLGIPYAKPPLGPLRFREPQPITKFYKGTVNARYTFRCLQWLVSLNNAVIGAENCLYLNIYTTTLNETANYNVLVFIHGGGFFYGAGHTQTQEYLLSANKNLVFVSVNYRLGPFGFLSTEDDIVPGNNGLKDQVMALVWVQENIIHFGGNPDKVTIAGMSAGGISVHLHYFSRMSRNLFSRGISMSGGALSLLVKTRNARKDAQRLAELVNCTRDNSTAMVDCLRDFKNGTLLLETLVADKPPWEKYNFYVRFEPVVENGGLNPFLDEHPFHLLQKGKVKNAPWLASTTTAEGLKPAGIFVEREDMMRELNEKWNEIAPYLLQFHELAPEDKLPKISQTIIDHYLNDKPISVENRDIVIKIIGDRLYMTNIENAIRLHASATKAPVYFYLFDYRGKYSMSSIFSNTKTDLGVSHVDDLIYILKMNKFQPLEQDRAMVERMIGIWTSFIETGVPDARNGAEWPQLPRNAVYKGPLSYVKIINSTLFEVTSSLDISRRQFWDSLPLDELHVSGDQKVPKYIETQQKLGWISHNFVVPFHYGVVEYIHLAIIEPIISTVVEPVCSKVVTVLYSYVARPLYRYVAEPLSRNIFESLHLNVVRPLWGRVVESLNSNVVQPLRNNVLEHLHNNGDESLPTEDVQLPPSTDDEPFSSVDDKSVPVISEHFQSSLSRIRELTKILVHPES